MVMDVNAEVMDDARCRDVVVNIIIMMIDERERRRVKTRAGSESDG